MHDLSPPSTELSEADFDLFRSWYLQEISVRYPLSTRETLDSIIEVHRLGYDPWGYFTLRKTIWKGVLKSGTVVAFTVATVKRGGSVKFGPTLVDPNLRNRGIGKSFRTLIEQAHASMGLRKSYSTTSLTNSPGIRYLARVGHYIEAHLHDHYRAGEDEVVLGRFLPSVSQPTTTLDTVGEDLVGQDKVLLQDLSRIYSDLDATFIRRIRRAARESVPLREESSYVEKLKTIISLDDHTVAVTTPKRTGVIKITPMTYPSLKALAKLLEEAECLYKSRNEVRKLFGLFPHTDLRAGEVLNRHGYSIEGFLREPYKIGVNMMVFGKVVSR